ncbi:MAG: hypothetical protein JO023_21930, partial [Chloroflexi bacterium]|nr:hypothetical protein [Chloroflexota bacterium]
MANAAPPSPPLVGGGRDRRPARLCLKARPTPVQLADRLQPIDGQVADGLELYLDAGDLADAA